MLDPTRTRQSRSSSCPESDDQAEHWLSQALSYCAVISALQLRAFVAIPKLSSNLLSCKASLSLLRFEKPYFTRSC